MMTLAFAPSSDGEDSTRQTTTTTTTTTLSPPDVQIASDAAAINALAFHCNSSLHLDPSAHASLVTPRSSPLTSELRVDTGLWNAQSETRSASARASPERGLRRKTSSALRRRSPSARPSLRANSNGANLSPASVASSPSVGPLNDITPLPSPLASEASPPWPMLAARPPRSTLSTPTSSDSSPTNAAAFALYRSSPPKKWRGHAAHLAGTVKIPTKSPIKLSHTRNRSHSEYVPDAPSTPWTRNVSASGSQTPTSSEAPKTPMHREEYLAVERGISSVPASGLPTPPPSTRGALEGHASGSPPASPGLRLPAPVQCEARMLKSGELRRWTIVRQLGTGTFSKVMLATSERRASTGALPESRLLPSSLVAVKICEHGPAGGANEKKIESSLKRELEILRTIEHPSLVHLKAFSVVRKRAFLVLNYCPGGDLFELASLKHHLLVPGLVRRIFAELTSAVAYLHGLWIVHRDIKLENVLVNVPLDDLPQIADYATHRRPLVTLTDLGLGRFVPQPPESPMLETRCGSEDYAAPELLMGQEYDGRATDAWALGVLLYAVMEGRLPFDPVPGARRQSPTSHRIARCEWSWVKWADKDGEWDPVRGQELEGGRQCVEGLLKRVKSRWGLGRVAETAWVKGGIQVEGGLRIIEEDD